ncbi:glutaredoxin family protein [Candidatus Parcubacteria bacterium]|nr:glutaredoxin family protein [Candidatus Parcubacteria bacterium]
MKKIIFYSKIGCPWCDEMRKFLEDQALDFEEREVLENSNHFEEMKVKSGQSKAPTLDIDGEIYADVGVEDVKKLF